MRITRRNKPIDEYWENRWKDLPVDELILNRKIYPAIYADIAIQMRAGLILEAGCGLGRLLRTLHNESKNIIGLDFNFSAIYKIKQRFPDVKVLVADIRNLPFKDETFSVILCFEPSHCLCEGPQDALKASWNTLKKSGVLCAEFRSDNIQNYLLDKLKNKSEQKQIANPYFHRHNFSLGECKALIKNSNFSPIKVYYSENFSFVKLLSPRSNLQEHKERSTGYKLGFAFQILQKVLMTLFPRQFCNHYICFAEKRLFRRGTTEEQH